MYVPCVVESVRVHVLTGQHVVLLQARDAERLLPIWIGADQAFSIACTVAGKPPERPLTHDLFASTLAELGVTIGQVVITSLAEETYHARLFLETDGRIVELDSRPSDALALAVRAGVRIYAAESVLDAAGLGQDAAPLEEDEEGAIGSTVRPESISEWPPDPRLDVFREFVNSIDEMPGEGGEGGRSS